MGTNRFLIVAVFILLLGLGALGFLYYQEKQAGTQEAARAEVKKLTDTIGKLVKLPSDETPTVATVIDSTKLKKNNPKFYEGVQNGDKLLVYTDRVVLYDVSEGVVLNMVLVDTTKLEKTSEGTDTVETNDTSETTDTTGGEVAGEEDQLK